MIVVPGQLQQVQPAPPLQLTHPQPVRQVQRGLSRKVGTVKSGRYSGDSLYSRHNEVRDRYSGDSLYSRHSEVRQVQWGLSTK